MFTTIFIPIYKPQLHTQVVRWVPGDRGKKRVRTLMFCQNEHMKIMWICRYTTNIIWYLAMFENWHSPSQLSCHFDEDHDDKPWDRELRKNDIWKRWSWKKMPKTYSTKKCSTPQQINRYSSSPDDFDSTWPSFPGPSSLPLPRQSAPLHHHRGRRVVGRTSRPEDKRPTLSCADEG